MDEKRLDIQWLRAIAATEVVCWHSDIITRRFSPISIQAESIYSPFGGVGVELFFIVSGYIICMRAPAYGTGGGFLISRIFRLYPLYWIFTALVLLAFAINPIWRLGNFELSTGSLIRSFLIWPQWGYPIYGMGWTLEHEMVFYSMVALWMMLTPGMGHWQRVWFGCGVAGLGALGMLLGTGGSRATWDFHLASPYLLLFALGWLTRVSEESAASAGRQGLWLAGWAALLTAAALAARRPEALLAPRFALVAAVFIAFVYFRRVFHADNALNRLMSKVGDASYSIYLVHFFVLSISGKILGRLGAPVTLDLPVRVVGGCLSICAGVAVFRFLEKPIDRLLRKRPAPMAPPANLAAAD